MSGRRVKIVGAIHPHRGATGTLSGETIYQGGAVLYRVYLDAPAEVSSCFVTAFDLIKLPQPFDPSTAGGTARG